MLDRMRREEDTRSWRESDDARKRPRVVVSPEHEERERRSRRRRWMAVGLVVLLLGVAAYVVLSGRLGSVPGIPGGSGGGAVPAADADRVPSPADTTADAAPVDAAPPSDVVDSAPSPVDTAIATAGQGVDAAEVRDTAATPELLDLFVGDSAAVARAMAEDTLPGSGDSALVVRPGATGGFWVGVRGSEGRARAGVELVLEGSDRLPGVDERLEVATDGRGRAVFRFPVGGVRDTVAMDVLARGYWLRGTNRVIVRPGP